MKNLRSRRSQSSLKTVWSDEFILTNKFKVGQLGIPISFDQDIIDFEIAINIVSLVKVFQAQNDSREHKPNTFLP